MYRRFLNNNDYLGIITQEALAQLTRGNDGRFVQVFRNEHAQSSTLGPKLMLWEVSRNFVAARHPFRKRVLGAYKA